MNWITHQVLACSKVEQCSVCEHKKGRGAKMVEKSMLKSRKKVGKEIDKVESSE